MEDQYKSYEFTIKVKTNYDPRSLVFKLVDHIKALMPVLSISYHLIEDRPTDVEHHGGVTDGTDESL